MAKTTKVALSRDDVKKKAAPASADPVAVPTRAPDDRALLLSRLTFQQAQQLVQAVVLWQEACPLGIGGSFDRCSRHEHDLGCGWNFAASSATSRPVTPLGMLTR